MGKADFDSAAPVDILAIADFPILNERDVKAAQRRARLLGTLVDFSKSRCTALGRSVKEIADNALRHSGSGVVAFRLVILRERTILEVDVSDRTPVPPELQVLLKGETGPDCGVRRAANLADELRVLPAELGKSIVLRFASGLLPDSIDETVVAEWSGILRARRTQSALISTQRRARQLAEQISTLQRQRHELENDLQQSRSLNETLTLLSLVASKTDNAVVIMDSRGLCTWINDAFIRMTGYSAQDAIGARPDMLLSGPETGSDVLREIEQAFQLGHGVTEEFLQHCRDGTTGWISLSLTPIHDDDGVVVRWIGIGGDITKRKEAELALKSARDAAETASQMKGQFLANISHEIRTPMNAIIGMTELTLATELREDQREYLTTVKQSAVSLLELLNDVLDLSRIESGRMEIAEGPLDLPGLVRDILKPLKFVAEQKGIALIESFAPELPRYVVGDSLRLRQVLVNLVGNAIKFTTEGTVEVLIETQWMSDGLAGLHFVVADTGIGISPDKLDDIFDAFTQADASVSRRFGGSGLGLAITSQLLALMNGRIWVQSEPGLGSRFHFTLKLKLCDDQQIRHLQEAEIAEVLDVGSSEASSELRILVADDHSANRDLIGKILEKRGHSVVFAGDGQQVLDLLGAEDFDVVLMDVQMPGIDGFLATELLRERERESQTHVPVIAVTAHASPRDREACLAAGMDAYLSKPISAAELLTLVDSLARNQANVSVTAAVSTGIVTVDEYAASADEESCPPTIASEKDVGSDDVDGSSDHPADELRPDHESAFSARHPFAEALERMELDEALLREQMAFFLQDGPELLRSIRAGLDNRDSAAIQIAAHRMKNLCATFDDPDAAQRCMVLELAAGENRVSEQMVQAVDDGVQALLQRIRAWLQSA